MNNTTLKTLLTEYQKKKMRAEDIALRKKEKLYEEFPELSNIDKKLSLLALSTMKELAKNNDKDLIQKLNFDIENLKKQKLQLFSSIGERANDIIPNYECKKCLAYGIIC